MARTKSTAKSAATSRMWVLVDGKVLPATGNNLPAGWTHWCNEGDKSWTPRGVEKEVG